MPPCERHDRKDPIEHRVGHEIGEQVRHRADEDPARTAPTQRLQQHLLVEEDLDVGAVARLERQARAEAIPVEGLSVARSATI